MKNTTRPRHARAAYDLDTLERRALLAQAATAVNGLHVPGLCTCAGCAGQNHGNKSIAEAMRDRSTAKAAPRGTAGRPLSDLPRYSSNPGAPVTLFIDFDGTPAFTWQGVRNPATNAEWQVPATPAFTIDANANDFTNAELDAIGDIYVHVAEKYSMFNVNVTTIDPGNRNDAQTACIVVGGSVNDWYMQTAGGSAPLEGFTRGDRSNTGFVWSADAIDAGSVTLNAGDRHYLGETVAHEAGHLFGLQHQSVVNGSTVTTVYSNGDATRAPIMGNSSNNSAKRALWWNGPSSGTDASGNPVSTGNQDDLAVLTRPGNIIAYRADDFGDGVLGTSGSLFVDGNGVASASGRIELVTDADAFVFNPVGTSISLTVNNAAFGGMLSPTLELRKISGANPAFSVTTTATSATLTCSNVVPGDGYFLVVKSAGGYGNVGQYTITGSTGAYATLDAATGTVNIAGYGDSNNNITLSYIPGTDRVVVQNDIFGGSAIQQFPRAQVQRVRFALGAGSDRVSLLSALGNIPVTVNADGGSDLLILEGTSGADTQRLLAGDAAQNNSTPVTYSGVDQIILTGFDGADYFDLQAVAVPVTVNGGTADDRIDVGSVPFAGAFIEAPVAVNGEGGVDTLNMGSNNADSILSTVTFSGGGQNDRVNYNDTAPSYRLNYLVGASSVSREGLSTPKLLNYFGVGRLFIYGGNGTDTVRVGNGVGVNVEAYGNDGDDVFYRGDGNLAGASGANFFGGNGNDTITFDDRNNPGNVIFDVQPNAVAYGGLILQSTAGFESLAILAGTGANEITFSNSITQAVTVDAGPGNDTVTMGFTAAAGVFAPVTVLGGAGNDSFVWRNGSNNWFSGSLSIDTYPVLFDGGADFNSLSIDDTVRGAASYQFYADRIYQRQPLTSAGMDLSYDNMGAVGLSLSNSANAVQVFGTSADIRAGNQVSIATNGGNDNVTLFARDAAGNFSLNGTLGVGGGAGTDTLTIDDAASAAAIDYRFLNQFGPGTTNIAGLGASFGAGADFEGLVINASSGNDTFVVDRYLAATALTVNAGDGDDSFSLTPVSQNLAANLATTANNMTFNGGGGYDSFTLANAANNNGNYYDISQGSMNVTSLIGSATFSAFFSYSGVESTAVTGGPRPDTFVQRSSAPGSTFNLDGGPGVANDSFAVGYPFADAAVVSGIQGGLYLNGGEGGTDNVTIYNYSDTVGRVLQIDANSVGAAAGDNLFGPGGFLYYANITGTFNVKLGGGSDTVFVVPTPNTPFLIEGNGQDPGLLAGGDFIGLALAGVTDPVFTPGAAGAGTYTGTDVAAVSYTGMESTDVDDVRPEPVSVSFSFDATQMYLDLAFSEDVSGSFSTASFELTDAAGQVVPYYEMASSYDASTNTARVTFLDPLNGVLPDGSYRVHVPAGLRDVFGNASVTELEFDFAFHRGDMNYDGVVNNQDIAPFVQALTSPAGFEAQFGYAPDLLGDVNRDGRFNNLDIAAFVALLTGGRPTTSPTATAARTAGGTVTADLLIGPVTTNAEELPARGLASRRNDVAWT
jgi:hypothetical protein